MTTTAAVAYASQYLFPSRCAITNAEDINSFHLNPPLKRGVFYANA